MAKLIENKRKVLKKGDKFIFVLEQKQEYDAEAGIKLVEDWKKELADKEKWLENKDALVEQMIKVGKEHIDQMEGQIKTDIASLKEVIKMWENAK